MPASDAYSLFFVFFSFSFASLFPYFSPSFWAIFGKVLMDSEAKDLLSSPIREDSTVSQTKVSSRLTRAKTTKHTSHSTHILFMRAVIFMINLNTRLVQKLTSLSL